MCNYTITHILISLGFYIGIVASEIKSNICLKPKEFLLAIIIAFIWPIYVADILNSIFNIRKN